MEGFCGNPYPHLTPRKGSSLDRKPSRRTLENWDRDAGV